ncbi:MAG TPA: hypothetical protein VGP72_08185 [Planctomycetota bacterium]
MATPKYFKDPQPGVMSALVERTHADILDWCAGRHWPLRALLLSWLAYVGVRQFWDPMYAGQNLFAAINLGIHEGGHLLTGGMGKFICAAAGSFLQCAVPVISVFVFLKQRDYFGISVCFGWLSINFVSVGVYMADAQKMALPLVTVGGGSGHIEEIHDWHFLFGRMGLLNMCEEIGGLTRFLGHVSMLACMIAGGWLLWKMATLPKPKRKPSL